MKPMILDVECIVCNKKLQKIKHDPREVCREMGKIANRRSRTPNWSIDEKQYLLELIKEYKEVVVTKSNNGPNLSEEKDVAWNEILRRLTGKFGNKFSGFSIKKVKTQWQNMKRIAREEINNNGTEFQKYSKLSFDVCNLLQIIKDGALKNENDFNETIISADIEIKTETIDEYMNEAGCSKRFNLDNLGERNDENIVDHSSESSVLEHISDSNDLCERPKENYEYVNKKSIDTMTDTGCWDHLEQISSLRKELEKIIRCTESEKQLKLESLKDERQVMRAMRETAELNKIIAEQKLKHVLWIKKQEIAFVSFYIPMERVLTREVFENISKS